MRCSMMFVNMILKSFNMSKILHAVFVSIAMTMIMINSSSDLFTGTLGIKQTKPNRFSTSYDHFCCGLHPSAVSLTGPVVTTVNDLGKISPTRARGGIRTTSLVQNG